MKHPYVLCLHSPKDKGATALLPPPSAHRSRTHPTGVRIGSEKIELVFWRPSVVISTSLIFNRACRISQNRSITLIMRLPGIRRSVVQRVIVDHRFRTWTRGERSHLIS